MIGPYDVVDRTISRVVLTLLMKRANFDRERHEPRKDQAN